MTRPDERGALVAFAAVSFAYFAYSGLIATYLPLWYQSLGFGTLAIGGLVSMQSSTRLFAPYAWGWLADHTGRPLRLLRIGVVGALLAACALWLRVDYAWIAGAAVVMFVCTAGITPISEAALAHHVSRDGGKLDTRLYGRVRLWGSVGFVIAVFGSGFLLQGTGMGWFPGLLIGLLVLLFGAAARLPASNESGESVAAANGAAGGGGMPSAPVPRVLEVLRRPVVGWFFAGMFFTILAHTALYAFFSLYLVSLGYGKGEVGAIWAIGVVCEIGWFWFQGHWAPRLSTHGWLVLAAAVSVARFALLAAFGSRPWLLVLTQCSHAITFAAQHTACVGVLNQHFPGRLRGRGQALYTVLGYGGPGVIGGVAGGALSQWQGFPAVFWGASGAALVATACCWRALVLDRRDALREGHFHAPT